MTRAAFPTVSSVSWMPACLLSSVLRTLEAPVSKRHPYTTLAHSHIHTQRIDCTATTIDINCKTPSTQQRMYAHDPTLFTITCERENDGGGEGS